MSEAEDHNDDHYGPGYQGWDELDFSVITSRLRQLPLFDDDMWLGMQAMNVGLVDMVVTQHELELLAEYMEIERTPMQSALTVSALSQMWVYGLYEVLRLWRDRRYQLKKLYDNGGIDLKLASMPSEDEVNLAAHFRRKQLEQYKIDADYRNLIDRAWERLEPIFRMVELFRMNLAKHSVPGTGTAIPRAPGYGRINMMCGSMIYELLDKEGFTHFLNRRDIADQLRKALADV
ncbi:hypothetical protein [Pseudoxanthomonas sp.]|uniref:hypothetical protein n=1 Tax=Pseudoxanthomonas sp. TaxID=1871049 RepID=UPI003F7E9D5B